MFYEFARERERERRGDCDIKATNVDVLFWVDSFGPGTRHKTQDKNQMLRDLQGCLFREL